MSPRAFVTALRSAQGWEGDRKHDATRESLVVSHEDHGLSERHRVAGMPQFPPGLPGAGPAPLLPEATPRWAAQAGRGPWTWRPTSQEGHPAASPSPPSTLGQLLSLSLTRQTRQGLGALSQAARLRARGRARRALPRRPSPARASSLLSSAPRRPGRGRRCSRHSRGHLHHHRALPRCQAHEGLSAGRSDSGV